MNENQIAKEVLDAALTVHKRLGPGLLESAYRSCLAYELRKRELKALEEVPLPLTYDEIELDCGYRIDLFVEDKFIVELKTVEKLNDIHMAQILTYLKQSECKLGLLINFNVTKLRNGVKRVINGVLKE